MPTLSVISSGLLLEEPNFALWTLGTGFSIITGNGFAIYDSAPRYILEPEASGSDAHGVREIQCVLYEGVWWFKYDGGDGTNGFIQQLAMSTDRGYTITKLGNFGMGYSDGAAGIWASTATGWLQPQGGVWYDFRVLADNVFASGFNQGLPAAGPYLGDVWHAASPDAVSWTFDDDLALSGWASYDLLPGSVIEHSGGFLMYVQGGSGAGFQIGYQTASALGGPWTLGASLFGSAKFAGPRNPENPKGFKPSIFPGTTALLVNLIAPTGTHTDQNALLLSNSATDFSGSDPVVIQSMYYPNTSNAQALGCVSHLIGADGALIEDPTYGVVPVIWDADPTQVTPGWHIFRKGRIGLLEPYTHTLRYNNLTTTRYRSSIALAHTNIVLELAFGFIQAGSGDCDISVEVRSNGTTGYRFMFRGQAGANWLRVEKMDGTTIQDGTVVSAGVQVGVEMIGRISIIDNVIQAWLGGERQIVVLDSTYTSGTQIAISCLNNIGYVRAGLRAYSDFGSTVTGMSSEQSVRIRSFCDVPWFEPTTASFDGLAEFSSAHYPLAVVETPVGDATTPDGKLWGGSIYAWDSGPQAPTSLQGLL